MAIADDLLEKAKHLANREPKRPRQASLRRAISAAYYGLFHLLVSEVIRNWKIASQRYKLARALEHAPMKKACTKKNDELNRYFKEHRTHDQARLHLQKVVSTFVQAQQDRHDADYDNPVHWAKTDVIAKIDAISDAYQSWKVIRREEEVQEFLISLFGFKER